MCKSDNALLRIAREQEGNVSILFGLIGSLLILAVGVAIDYASFYNRSEDVQAALDTAVLAGARSPGNEITIAGNVFSRTLSATQPDFDQSTLSPSFSVLPGGGVTGSTTGQIKTLFLGIVGIRDLPLSVGSTAERGAVGNTSKGCVFLTDPSNTGLEMQGTSSMSADCTIQITTDAVAIDMSGNSTASFDAICAAGTINAPVGSLTPEAALPGCTPVVDPFNMLSPPQIVGQGCTSSGDIAVANSQTTPLAPGVHCGAVTVDNGGTLELASGMHVFRGGLNAAGNSTITGTDLMMVFEENINTYVLDGNVDITGLMTGDFQGFVIYHEDYVGSSNTVEVGPVANFKADGLIYLPNTHIIISSNANELATRSILVTDRLEFSGNSSFTATIQENSNTPLPPALLDTEAGTLRLTR